MFIKRVKLVTCCISSLANLPMHGMQKQLKRESEPSAQEKRSESKKQKLEPSSVEQLDIQALVPAKDTLRAITAHNRQVAIPSELVNLSRTLKALVQDLGTEGLLPLSAITDDMLSQVLELMKVINDTINASQNNAQFLIDQLNLAFHKKSLEQIIKLFEATNYLDIPLLNKYISTLLATQINQKEINEDQLKLLERVEQLPVNLSSQVKAVFEALNAAVLNALVVYPTRTFVGAQGKLSSHGKSVLVIGNYGETIYVWDLQKDSITHELKSDKSCHINEALFSSDGKAVLAYTTFPETHTMPKGYTIWIWDMKTGKIVRELKGNDHTSVELIRFSPDSKKALIAAGCLVTLLDIETAKPLKELKGYNAIIRSIVFSPDGKKALIGYDDCIGRLWDLEAGKVIQRIESDYKIAMSPDGKTALTANVSTEISLWDLHIGKQIKQVTSSSKVVNIAVSPDGKTALIGTYSKLVYIIDLETGATTRMLQGHQKDFISSLEFNFNGKQALTTSTSSPYSEVCLWDLSFDGFSISQLVLIVKCVQLGKDKVLKNSYFKELFETLPFHISKQLLIVNQ